MTTETHVTASASILVYYLQNQSQIFYFSENTLHYLEVCPSKKAERTEIILYL